MKRRIPAMLAFVLPAALALVAFATAGIFPFGPKTLLVADMNIEYIDYFAQLGESLRTGGSLLRSWNMGMGLNMLGLLAFYCASPLNLIIAAVPTQWITEAVLAVTVIKIGLCGLSFFIWSGFRFPQGGVMLRLAFSVAWGLCGYNICYSSNIMWLDGVALLPLVLLGAERVLRQKRCGVYIAALAGVFFTSYYIGYMVGGFSLLWFLATFFCEKRDRRELLPGLGRVLGSAALAACFCAVLLLPAFLNLRTGQASLWDVPLDPSLDKTFVRVFSKLVPGAYDSLTDAAYPNIFCSMAAVFGTALFFASKKIPAREKIAVGSLLGFLLMSFSCNLLDLAWHAFEVPTWYPARYSFVFSFVLLAAGMRALLEKPSRREVLLAGGAVCLLLLETAVNRYRFLKLWQILAAAGLVLCYALLLRLPRHGRSAAALMLLLVCGECLGGAALMIRGVDRQFQYRDRASYRRFMDEYGAAVEAASALDSGVFRLEIMGQRGPNGGMALGYNGISHYSTTTDQALNQYLKSLGYNDGTVNELRFARNTPLTNGLLGVRYVLARGDPGAGYEEAAHAGGVIVYRNLCDFPVAQFAPSLIESLTSDNTGPFELQNRLLLQTAGSEPFRLLEAAEIFQNVEKIHRENYIEYIRLVRNRPATVEFVLQNPERREVYAYFPVYDRKYATSEIYLNGGLLQKDLGYRNNTVLSLGSDAEIRVAISLSGDKIQLDNAFFASLDLDECRALAQAARENAMRFTEFGDTSVQGMATAPVEGFLATTIPFDEGWSVKVDGEPARTQRFAGVFLAVALSAGEHVVEMSYLPPGFLAGGIVSLLSLAGTGAWIFLRRGRS